MNIDGPFLWFLFYSFHCPNLASPSKTSKRLVWQTAGGKNVNYTAACLFSAWCQHLCFGINWTEGLITGYSVLDYRSEGEIIVAFSHAGRSGGEKIQTKTLLLTKCNNQHWLTGSWNSVQFLMNFSKRSWHKQENEMKKINRLITLKAEAASHSSPTLNIMLCDPTCCKLSPGQAYVHSMG